MKNKELFDKTIGILVNAYLNETLEHGNCYACAVGNIVAANCGYTLIKPTTPSVVFYSGLGELTFSPSLKFDDLLTHVITGNLSEINDNHASQLLRTGYTIEELEKVENAFEGVSAYVGLGFDKKTSEQYMFDGLMAVCDTLMQIHEASNEEITQAKRLFVKEPA